jgi:hypothetical protein
MRLNHDFPEVLDDTLLDDALDEELDSEACARLLGPIGLSIDLAREPEELGLRYLAMAV